MRGVGAWRRAAPAARFLWERSAILACALALIAGVAVVDDYGVTWDEPTQRALAAVSADYALERDPALLAHRNRHYGVAFELPLLFAERALGLEDSRDVYLARHLLTHFFFVAGGFACALLVYRIHGSRALALFALLLFLLHPRLYAHSFFNSKDIPFLSMFMICLLLTHRAFRNDTGSAFLLAGAGIGLLTGIRLAGVVLFAAVLAMRALDLLFARGRAERGRVLASGGLFALAAAFALYLSWPYLWSDPAGHLAEAFARSADFPHELWELYRGEVVDRPDPPFHYVPVWFAITTPVVALATGAAGAAAVAWGSLRRPREALRNTELRFGLLLAACLALPVIAAVALESRLYNGWRQMYFLYAPFCLLAALGLQRLAAALRRTPLRSGTATYALAAAGLGVTLYSMIDVHPHQQVWFNALVDRTTPERLRSRYELDYWGHPYREALEYLLGAYPGAVVSVDTQTDGILHHNRAILPEADRRRIVVADGAARFWITNHYRQHTLDPVTGNVVHTRKVFGNTILTVAERDAGAGEAGSAALREAYRSARAAEPAARSVFDVYLGGNALTYVKDPCGPDDTGARFFLHFVPEDAGDLPAERRRYGFANADFAWSRHGGAFDGACLAAVPLPGYPVARVRTGQTDGLGDRIWQVEFPVRGQAAAPGLP